MWIANGILFCGAVAIALIVLCRSSEATIKTPEDVEQYLQLRTLAAIPIAAEAKKGIKRWLVPQKGKEAGKEPYGNLCRSTELCGDNINVIAITSCVPNEGKSSVAFELASAMAKANKKVLLVEGDLRSPVLAQRHHKGKSPLGLVHYLIGRCSMAEVITKTDEKNLDMVFAGLLPPNAEELLGNQRFADMLTNAEKEYDFVIVDTPPLGSVRDGVVVAKQSDGVILVIAEGEIDYCKAQDAKLQLEREGSHILGCVLNKTGMQ